ncbi:hypothetical protein R3P38DRAFT_3149811, partial [Favolaschia claudopus]
LRMYVVFVCCRLSNSRLQSNEPRMNFVQKVILTEGQDLISKYDDKATTSGNTLTRHFCSNCGSCLFLNSPSTASEWITLSPATVDGQEWVPRRYNCPDGKLSWVVKLHMECKDTV